MDQLLKQVERLVEPAFAQKDVELVDLTYQKSHGGWTLSFFIDRPGGITLDECAHWNQQLGDMLDASNLLDRTYVMEVSSPGLDRPLRKPKDFVRFAGRTVHVKTIAPEQGQRNFHGVLLGGDNVVIRVKLDDGREVALPQTNVAKCRLKPEIDF